MQLYYYNGQPTNYFITENGKLYNQKTNKWLKGTYTKYGYLVYTLKIEGFSKKLFAHRMVLETFSPREDSYLLVVNHKDFNPSNNSLSNLEWCSQTDNVKYSVENGRYLKRKIYAFNDKKEKVGEWDSLESLKVEKGFMIGNISYNAKQPLKRKINGFYWSYEENGDFEIDCSQYSSKAKKVGKYNLQGELIEVFQSINEASRAIKGNHSHIVEACNGKLKTYKGFIWKKLV